MNVTSKQKEIISTFEEKFWFNKRSNKQKSRKSIKMVS